MVDIPDNTYNLDGVINQFITSTLLPAGFALYNSDWDFLGISWGDHVPRTGAEKLVTQVTGVVPATAHPNGKMNLGESYRETRWVM